MIFFDELTITKKDDSLRIINKNMTSAVFKGAPTLATFLCWVIKDKITFEKMEPADCKRFALYSNQ